MNPATHSFHHPQPKPKPPTAQLITPAEFYLKLLNHDWYYAWSDDSSAYSAGQAADAHLEQLAKNGGSIHKWLLKEVGKHFTTGEPWGNDRHPLPAPPTELTTTDVMMICIELAKAQFALKAIQKFAAFLPSRVKTLDPIKPLLEKVYLHGFYAGNLKPLTLIARHPTLSKAWEDGQAALAQQSI